MVVQHISIEQCSNEELQYWLEAATQADCQIIKERIWAEISRRNNADAEEVKLNA